MKVKSATPVFAGVFALQCLGSAVFFPCIADEKPACTGDKSACDALKITQSGTDPASGAHVIIKLGAPQPGYADQPIYMELSLAKQKSECGSGARTALANVNPSDSRSIDGYLCKLKATWQRR